jgi:hypothetical protein
MKYRVAAHTAILLACTHALAATPLNIRLGTWEMTTTTSLQGNMMPQHELAQMPPEQRAKFEAAMKARAAKPSTQTTTECVTQEDLDHMQFGTSDDDSCTQKILSQTATRAVFEQDCAAPEASKSSFSMDAPDPQHTHMSGTITRLDGDGSGKVSIDISGHWKSAGCEAQDDE